MSSHEWRWRAQDALHGVAERVRARAGAARLEAEGHRQSAHEISARRVRRRHRGRELGRRPRCPRRPAAGATATVRARSLVCGRHASSGCSPGGPRRRRMPRPAPTGCSLGHYDLLGYRGVPCAPEGRVDWHGDPVHRRRAPRVFYADVPFLSPEIGDHKIIWELNRHQHWLQLGRAAWLTGDARYAQAIVTQLDGWLTDNPPFVGVNWASMLEIGFRTISWTWALHCLARRLRLTWELEVGSWEFEPVAGGHAGRTRPPAHARRAPSLLLLQPEHAPHGRSARPLRRRNRVAGAGGERQMG